MACVISIEFPSGTLQVVKVAKAVVLNSKKKKGERKREEKKKYERHREAVPGCGDRGDIYSLCSLN